MLTIWQWILFDPHPKGKMTSKSREISFFSAIWSLGADFLVCFYFLIRKAGNSHSNWLRCHQIGESLRYPRRCLKSKEKAEGTEVAQAKLEAYGTERDAFHSKNVPFCFAFERTCQLILAVTSSTAFVLLMYTVKVLSF